MTVSITIIIPGQEIMKHMCHVSPTCLQYPLIKWSGGEFMLGWKKEEKKKQSIKPSNDKYGIALSSEYYSRSLRMLGRLLGMKRRSLFVCKWEIDYIYLLAEGLVIETRTHTQRRARDPPPHQ